MSTVNVFVSFDVENDVDLYKVLLEQSKRPGSDFSVSACSTRGSAAEASRESSRQKIRQADQVIVICGEHTQDSIPVSVELGMAQQEGTPYFLLWGRRELMCTKPVGAKHAEGMFSWTRQILREQIAFTVRKASSDAAAQALRTVPRKSGSSA